MLNILFRSNRKRLLMIISRHHFNDEIQESALWGPLYDGRAIISVVHEEFLAGASTEECLKRLKETYSQEDGKKLISTWA